MSKYDDAIKRALPGMSVVSVYEYPSCFVYNMIADRYKEKTDSSVSEKILDSSFSVDKRTMIVSPFRPFEMSVNEYLKGKKIK